MAVDGLSPQAEYGDRETVWEQDPYGYRRFIAAGSTESPPDPGEASIIFGERLKGGVPRHLRRLGCFNVYMPVGECVDPSNLLQGWTEYVHAMGGARPNGAVDLGTRSQFDESSRTQAELDISFERYFVVAPLSFARANTEALLTGREVAGLTYLAGGAECTDCETTEQPTQRIYAALQSALVPETSPSLIYSLDGGATWTAFALGGTDETFTVTGLYSVGGSLVLTFSQGGTAGFTVVALDSAGTPLSMADPTFIVGATGTAVSLGMVNAQEVFLGATGGVWRLTLSNGGATQVLDTGAAVATVSANDMGLLVSSLGSLWVSYDGRLFEEAEAPAGAAALGSGLLTGQGSWYVADGADLYYTGNGGASYVTVATNYDSGLTMVCPEVLYYVGGSDSGLFSTWYGGALWTNRAPRVGSLPAGVTLSAEVAPAVPFTHDLSLAVNTIALAGADGADGVIILGSTRWL